jgi:hypothetical protein
VGQFTTFPFSVDILSGFSYFYGVLLGYSLGKKGDIWHTSLVLIFRVFSINVKLNVMPLTASNIPGLHSGLQKFDAIRKQQGERLFCMCANLHRGRGNLADGKITWKIKMPTFQGKKVTQLLM